MSTMFDAYRKVGHDVAKLGGVAFDDHQAEAVGNSAAVFLGVLVEMPPTQRREAIEGLVTLLRSAPSCDSQPQIRVSRPGES